MGVRHVWNGAFAGLTGLFMTFGLPATAQEYSPMTTDTPITIERTEGPLVDLEVFGEDGPFHIQQQDIIATIRTVEGRPLTDQEKDEARSFALTCPSESQPYDITEGETEDGAFVISFVCE